MQYQYFLDHLRPILAETPTVILLDCDVIPKTEPVVVETLAGLRGANHHPNQSAETKETTPERVGQPARGSCGTEEREEHPYANPAI